MELCYKIIQVAARLVEHISEISVAIVELLIRTGMTREEADKVATVIQTAFRKHLQRKEELRRAGELLFKLSSKTYKIITNKSERMEII